ncbi:MAG: hypothetical protein RBQ71_04070 [Acholeplasmataceae bacterium]|jgi:hypothetical protein|nr:hypothetical protein [Acholeplasmataceae bacterium]
MEKYILPALVANAATLGIHWIYDHKYIEKMASQQPILFTIQSEEHYRKAENAYYCYPDHKLGDVTVQGHILKWLYQAMKENKDFSQQAYADLLFNQFKPGGTYHGYVESYAKKHVLNSLARDLDVPFNSIPMMDDHLVGFMPYLVCKELGIDTKKAWELTQVYSKDEDYYTYFKMFDQIFDLIPEVGLKNAIELAIKKGPKKYLTHLQKAIEIKDTNMFINSYSGRSCAIKYSIPLVIHILYHTNSYEEAVQYNALLGGAISDRNLLIGAICAQSSHIPKDWKEKVIDRIKL